jgi:hypothetical protein
MNSVHGNPARQSIFLIRIAEPAEKFGLQIAAIMGSK